MDPFTTSADRSRCWDARDAHFTCLDSSAAAAKPANPPPNDPCAPTRVAYEARCLASWRRHWDERYKHGRPIVGRK